MHILGHGDPVTLATTLHNALGVSNTPLANDNPQSGGSAPTPAIDLDTPMIDQTLGVKGKVAGTTRQALRPRRKLGWIYSAPLAGFYAAVDSFGLWVERQRIK
jgi:hypothetical protein